MYRLYKLVAVYNCVTVPRLGVTLGYTVRTLHDTIFCCSTFCTFCTFCSFEVHNVQNVKALLRKPSCHCGSTGRAVLHTREVRSSNPARRHLLLPYIWYILLVEPHYLQNVAFVKAPCTEPRQRGSIPAARNFVPTYKMYKMYKMFFFGCVFQLSIGTPV